MKRLCILLAIVILLSAAIPQIIPVDAIADAETIYSGGAIDSAGHLSISADNFMEELISIMNSKTALSALEGILVSLGDTSIPLTSEFTFVYQDERFYVLQYKGMEFGAVSFLKDGNPASGNSSFDSVGIQIPNKYYISPFFLFNSCCSALFLTAPSCNFEDALLIVASLLSKQEESRSSGKNPYVEVSTELFSYSIESFPVGEEDDTWQYLFIISQI